MNTTSMSDASADALRLISILSHGEPEDRLPRIDSVGAADRPSFDTLLQLFHKRIFNLSYRLLGDRDEASDLTQETFVKAYKAYPRFHGAREAVYPWLCRIAVNSCKNRFKEMDRVGRFEVMSLDEPLSTDDSTIGVEVGDDSGNPASVFAQHELEARVQEAMLALPPEFRLVIVLRDMQGLSYKEITDVSGLSMETVKARLFRGRGMLRRKLSAYIQD